MRLAETKAKSCAVEEPSLVIGSDQVCVIDGEIIGKLHTREKAIEQLSRQSGKSITFARDNCMEQRNQSSRHSLRYLCRAFP